jgi:hypothetical protein
MGIAVLAAMWTVTLAAPSGGQTRSVSGQAGVLAEWDLTATVTENPDGGGRQWSGNLSMKHVGFCSVDGPEEKTGELRLTVSDPPGELTALLLIDGTACTFKGHFKDGYDGVMTCPDRRDIPMMLTIQ